MRRCTIINFQSSSSDFTSLKNILATETILNFDYFVTPSLWDFLPWFTDLSRSEMDKALSNIPSANVIFSCRSPTSSDIIGRATERRIRINSHLLLYRRLGGEVSSKVNRLESTLSTKSNFWPDDKFHFSNFPAQHRRAKRKHFYLLILSASLVYPEHAAWVGAENEDHKKINSAEALLAAEINKFMPFSSKWTRRMMMKIRGIIDIIFMFISWSSRIYFQGGISGERGWSLWHN